MFSGYTQSSIHTPSKGGYTISRLCLGPVMCWADILRGVLSSWALILASNSSGHLVTGPCPTTITSMPDYVRRPERPCANQTNLPTRQPAMTRASNAQIVIITSIFGCILRLRHAFPPQSNIHSRLHSVTKASMPNKQE